MKIVQAIKAEGQAFRFTSELLELTNPLVLIFGNRLILEENTLLEEVQRLFPLGQYVFGSTSGEIMGSSVYDGSIVLTAIEFEKGWYSVKRKNIAEFGGDEQKLGQNLMQEFSPDNLRHVFILSDGNGVNGSALIAGIEANKISNIGLSGGLCGDDDRFEKTLCSFNEKPKVGEVVAIGFYGESFEITSANYGGWTPFGPERIITKSKGNILYELDGKPALDLYKKYLGEKALDLPKSALMYPLSIFNADDNTTIVRTILNIDESANAMILAGDVKQGATVQLMMSTVDDIARGARSAAECARKNRNNPPELSLLVSCVGRKLLMDQRTEEEIDEVIAVIGDETMVAGFYSYGEMAPFAGNGPCKLHNQTMTLTLLSE